MGMPRRHRYFIPPSREVIATCSKCGDRFTWLPYNFDMRHRFNRETHQFCGGEIALAQSEDASRKKGIMTKEEFCARFKARMLQVAGEKFDDGESIADYADETAPTYWDEPDQRADGPEECADADMSYWGEE